MSSSKTDPHTLTPSFELVRPNWQLLTKHLTAVIYLSLLPTLLYTLGSLLVSNGMAHQRSQVMHLHAPRYVGILLIAMALVWLVINLGPYTYFLTTAKDQPAQKIGYYYRQGSRFTLRLISLYILYLLMVIGGLILLIVPGVLLFKRYYLAPYFLVGKDISVQEAFKASAAASKLYSAPIWGVIGVQFAFTFLAGLISTFPLVGIICSSVIPYGCVFIPALRYREIAV